METALKRYKNFQNIFLKTFSNALKPFLFYFKFFTRFLAFHIIAKT